MNLLFNMSEVTKTTAKIEFVKSYHESSKFVINESLLPIVIVIVC